MYALITGATSGIGKEMSKLLANIGYDLVLVGRRENRLSYMKRYFNNKYGTDVLSYSLDLSKPENAILLFESCKELEITVVINAAGFGKVGYLTDTKLQDDLDMIETNITSLHILTKLFADHMDFGHILNVASIAAFNPGPFLAQYSATKSYVLSLSRAVNYEMKKQGKPVVISALCPGPVDTEFNKVAGTNFALRSISPKKCAFIGLLEMFKGKSVILPGIPMKAAGFISRFSPDFITLPVEYFIQTKKIKG